MPKETTNIKVSRASKEYWQAAKDVVDAAGDYAAAIKLKANLIDKSTAFKVKHVLDEHYHGNIANLDDAIYYRQKVFYGKVAKLNILCIQNGQLQVTKPEALLNFLLDARNRESFRGKIERRLKKDKVCSLQEFVGYKPKKS